MQVSIRAPREGGDSIPLLLVRPLRVSIRAPREGGDPSGHQVNTRCQVSIRAPREGGDVFVVVEGTLFWGFNPRPP